MCACPSQYSFDQESDIFFFYVFDPNPEKWQVCSKGLVSVFYKGFFYNHASEASLPWAFLYLFVLPQRIPIYY